MQQETYIDMKNATLEADANSARPDDILKMIFIPNCLSYRLKILQVSPPPPRLNGRNVDVEVAGKALWSLKKTN